MPTLSIHHSSSGFLKEAEYRMHVYTILKEYEDRFGQATCLTVKLDEVYFAQLGNPPASKVTHSEDGKDIFIQFYEWRYYDNTGNPSSQPSPHEVFQHLRSCLDKAAAEYVEKFPPQPLAEDNEEQNW